VDDVAPVRAVGSSDLIAGADGGDSARSSDWSARSSDFPDAHAPIEQAAKPPTGNILIARLSAKADLSDEALLPRGPQRKAAVYQDLLATAATSQVEALAKLKQLKATGEVTHVESMFLPNAILVTTKPGSNQAVRDALAGIASIGAVTENSTWSVTGERVSAAAEAGAAGATAGAAMLRYAQAYSGSTRYLDPDAGRAAIEGGAAQGAPPVPTVPGVDGAPNGAPATPTSSEPTTTAPPTAGTPPPGSDPATETPAGPTLEWGVAKMNAPAVWARGIDGTGVTIGVVDTGLDSQHPAIASHYRGTQAGGSQIHDYNWFDPFEKTPVAFDDGDHGTHVSGSAAGGTDSRAIGIAPGAKLIAAKAINKAGYNTTAATLRALQFMLAPTKTDGTAPDPTKGADVVNNSWGNSVDAEDPQFIDVFDGLQAAGIEVVTAAGNDGPREGTVSAPGSYSGHLSVAASTSKDTIAGFSSRGPSKFAKPEEMVPNITAPGANVVSSVPGGGYESMSGTSMASPHAAGAVALLLQAKPQATHEEIVNALTSTAVDVDRPGPDNASGFGRIDIDKAVAALVGGTPAGS